VPIKIIDTAGIRKTEDLVEKIGVEKSKEKINEADLIVLILDNSRAIEEEDKEIIEYIKDKKYIVLLNKIDLDGKINKDDLIGLNSDYIFNVSIKTGENIEKIKECIKELFFKGEIATNDIIITNTRHKEALFRAKENIESAIDALKNTFAIDLASIDIRNAWTILGQITGNTLEENIIDKIFSEFCLGK